MAVEGRKLRPFGEPSLDPFRLLVEGVQDFAIFMIDTEGRIATWNGGAVRIMGYETQEIIGKHFSCLYGSEDIAANKPWQTIQMAATTGRVEDEGWRVRPDGSLLWAQVILTAIRDETGRLCGFSNVFVDQTERRLSDLRRARMQIEQVARRENDEQFRLMVESVQDCAIFMLDPHGYVTTWNIGARRIKGYEPQAIIGQHFSRFYPEEDLINQKPWKELELAAIAGRVEDEGWRIRQDGTRFWANVIISAVRDDTGQLTGFAKVTRDLTERKRAEEERAKLQAEQAARSVVEAANRRLSFLADAGQALSESLEHEATLSQVARLAVPRIADWCSIFLIHEDHSVRMVASSHADPAKLKRLEEWQRHALGDEEAPYGIWHVLRTGQTEFFPSIDSATASAGGVGAGFPVDVGFQSSMIVPIQGRGRVMGVLHLACEDSGRQFDSLDLTMVEELAQRVALAVDNARLYRHAREAFSRLGESYALLQTFVNSVSSGFAFLDRDFRFLRINDSLAAFGGRPMTEYLGHTVREALPDLADRVEPAFRRVIEQGHRVDHMEISLALPAGGGHHRHLLVHMNPVVTPHRQIIGVGLLVTDITERKRMEESLRESEAHLAGQKQILEAIAEGAPLSDVLLRVVRFIEERSPGARCAIHLVDASGGFLRCSAAEGLPEAFRENIRKVPVGPGTGACALAAFTREPVLVADLAGDPRTAEEHEVSQKYGINACWAVPVFGRQRGVIGTITLYYQSAHERGPRDQKLLCASAHLVSIAIERSQAEDARNLKLQTLLEHMAEGMIAIDRDGRILVANPAAHRLLELRDSVQGNLLAESQLPRELCEGLKGAAESRLSSPTRLLMPQGEREVEAYVSPVATEFGRYGALTLLKDVTAEVQLRRLQSSFVANVSHELRGPLASISAVVEAVRDGMISDPDRLRYLSSVVSEIGRLRRLLDQLLELSKLDAGVLKLNVSEFDVADLGRALEELWTLHCANVGIQLKVDFPSIRLTNDLDALEQVLINLLENAVRFTPAGGTVRIDAQPAGRWLQINVADTGVGIPPEHIPYIWEPFYKADQARTLKPDSGTGLGLSIVKRLVDQMGGELRLESAVSEGTLFQVRLPLS